MFVWDSWLCYMDRKCRNKYFLGFCLIYFLILNFNTGTIFSITISWFDFSDKCCDIPFSNGPMMINFAVDIRYVPVGRGRSKFLYLCPILIALCCNRIRYIPVKKSVRWPLQHRVWLYERISFVIPILTVVTGP